MNYFAVSSKGTVVSNGDCEETSSFEAGYNAGKVYHEGKTTTTRVASTGDAVSIDYNNAQFGDIIIL